MKVIPDKNNFIEILEECLSSGNSSFVFVKLDGSKSLTCRILPEYANGKKVRCVEDNKVFKSIKEAADYYDCHTKEIRNAIKNLTECKGKHFHEWFNDDHAQVFDNYIQKG